MSLVVYAGGPGSAAAYAMYYLAFVLVAAYFFEPRFMAPYVLLSAGGFGLALLALDVGSTGWLTWALVVGTLTIGAGLAAALRSQLDGLVASLTVAAATDPLTGLANRREFNRRLSQEFERSARAGRPLGMIVIDLDGFKRVNDVFGHDAGDRALRRFAQLLLENTREIDIVARTGGEEFAILAPDADAARARMVAERLRNSTERAFAPPEPLTASCGVADHEEGGLDAPELLRAADRALYAAKREGRNRTVVYDPEHHDAEHMELPADGWTTTLPLDASEAA